MKLNITDKLQLEQPVLEIGEHRFTVDNSKDTMLAFWEMLDSMPEDKRMIDVFEDGIRHFLGDAAMETITAMRLTVKGYEKVLIAVLALAGEESFEDVEARFHRNITETAEPTVV